MRRLRAVALGAALALSLGFGLPGLTLKMPAASAAGVQAGSGGASGTTEGVVEEEASVVDREAVLSAEDREDVERAVREMPYPVVLELWARAPAVPDRETLEPPPDGLALRYIAADRRLEVRIGASLRARGMSEATADRVIDRYFAPTLASDGPAPALITVLRALADAVSEAASAEAPPAAGEAFDRASAGPPAPGTPAAPAEGGQGAGGRAIRWSEAVPVLLLGLLLASAGYGAFQYRRLRRREQDLRQALAAARRSLEGAVSALLPASDGDRAAEHGRRTLERLLRAAIPEAEAALQEGGRALGTFRLLRAEEEFAFVEAVLKELASLLDRTPPAAGPANGTAEAEPDGGPEAYAPIRKAEAPEAGEADGTADLPEGTGPSGSGPTPGPERPPALGGDRPGPATETAAADVPSVAKDAEAAVLALEAAWQAYRKRSGVEMPQMEKRLKGLLAAARSGPLAPEAEAELRALRADLEAAEGLMAEIETRLPEAIRQREARLRALQDTGKVAAQAELERALKGLKARWNRLWPLWADGDFAAVRATIAEIEAELQDVDRRLQAEGEARRGMDARYAEERAAEAAYRAAVEALTHRLAALARKFVLDDAALTEALARFEDARNAYAAAFAELERLVRDGHFALAEGQADALIARRKTAERTLAEAMEIVQTLENLEAAARDQVQDDRARLVYARQEAERAMLPELAAAFRSDFERAEALLQAVLLRLEHRPLSVTKLREALARAHAEATAAADALLGRLEDARRAEAIIARLNRFRLHDPDIGRYLMQAENCFRDRAFDKARAYAEAAWAIAEKKQAALR
ncbi:MAG: Chromosome partition protein smc [Hydrogenibacillus schlegelii]|uniref:Chromosome partition protein smc n=1 Tax=Hydrogenibacillus schlegelii TaxID=1484 RepID=A0A2T5GF68_HYDSH|nr:septation ring formation regulator EzrA [Hydrogenibacillus schlegelii]PTQ54837.1 MAG: Chromosome partition protein smc [Hydrogenibacillus schlegelii]